MKLTIYTESAMFAENHSMGHSPEWGKIAPSGERLLRMGKDCIKRKVPSKLRNVWCCVEDLGTLLG